MILAPYVLADDKEQGEQAMSLSARACAGDHDSAPASPSELDDVLRDARLGETPRHPALETTSATGAKPTDESAGEPGDGSTESAGGQSYGLAETLALYSDLSADVVVEAWYAAEARAWVKPYRQPSITPVLTGELPGPLDQWELSDELELIDWPATMALGSRVIPGVTTRQRSMLDDLASAGTESVQLDLYIDSSGSMPSTHSESPAVLAGTILILSVLRGGGRVRVTSFASPNDVGGTTGFTSRRSDAMGALLTFFGSGTTFPLDLLEQRYSVDSLRKETPPSAIAPRRHLVVLSDDGLASMFGEGQPEYLDVAATVRPLLDTATLLVMDSRRSMSEPAAAAGYDVDYLDSLAAAPAACAKLARVITAGAHERRGAARG